MKDSQCTANQKVKLSKVALEPDFIQFMILSEEVQKHFQNVKTIREKVDCPTCDQWIHEMCLSFPNQSKNLSILFCSKTKKELGEDNLPIVFPNLIVYGLNFVKYNIERNNGVFVCPFTQQNYKEEQLKKIFV